MKGFRRVLIHTQHTSALNTDIAILDGKTTPRRFYLRYGTESSSTKVGIEY